MDKTTIDLLAERVVRLERENRWLKRVGAVILAGAILVMAGGAQRAKGHRTVEAEQFHLVDKAGRLRALLDMCADNTPTLAFYDQQGENRARLIQGQDGSMGLSFFDKDGIQQMGIGIEKDGTRGLSFDKDGKRRLGVGLNPDGSAVLGFMDEAGKNLALLGQRSDGSVGLSFYGGKTFLEFLDGDKDRLSLGVNLDGNPSLKLIGKSGNPLLEVPQP